ncbi:MAG: dCMP deaminase family protein [Oscillospiraceae bacterium]|nr:dCMP deaminase family protein [Oscillospiraceae bacterium]
MKRLEKINYYLNIAKAVSERATCHRRKFGAIIVKNDEIISTGYNGAPRGRENCCDLNRCIRDELNIPRGERYELCRSVHAEANCIISASRDKMMGATMYLACVEPETGKIVNGVEPCSMCKRLIINAGISYIIIMEKHGEYRTVVVEKWVEHDDSIDGGDSYSSSG